LKPVAWACLPKQAIKKPWIAPEPAVPSKIMDRSIYSKPFGLAEWISNRFWHIVSVVKERTPLSSRKALLQPNEYAKRRSACQQRFAAFPHVFHRRPQAAYFRDCFSQIVVSTKGSPFMGVT